MLKNLFRSTLLLGMLAGVAGVAAYGAISYLITREDPVIMPNLSGEDIIPALQTLAGLGLYPKIEALNYSATVEKNRVIHQEPAPGLQIKKGREVRITLSKGPMTATLPDLIGLSLHEARAILISQGFCQGQTAHTREAERSADEVLAQTPGSGTVISREDCVDLLVNQGVEAEAYLMPDFTGESVAGALAQIAELGLNPGPIRDTRDPGKPAEIVVSQNPAQGSPIYFGQPVELVVNASRHGENLTPPDSPPATRLFRHRLAPGFLKQRVRIQWQTGAVSEDLFDDFVPPGEEVWVLLPGYQNAAVEIFESETLVRSGKFEIQSAN
ncbi:MAG: PASTA domain-containing protein [Desulfobacterales bacterium]